MSTQYCYPNKNWSYFHLKHRNISVPSDLSGLEAEELLFLPEEFTFQKNSPPRHFETSRKTSIYSWQPQKFLQQKIKETKNLKQLAAENQFRNKTARQDSKIRRQKKIFWSPEKIKDKTRFDSKQNITSADNKKAHRRQKPAFSRHSQFQKNSFPQTGEAKYFL